MKYILTCMACLLLFLQQLSAALPERLYLMTDRMDYARGERAYLRCMMTDARSLRPIEQSRYVYVELLYSGEVYSRVMLKAEQGAFLGHIDIPDDIPSGHALLRAYTRLNANRPELESLVKIYISPIDGQKTEFTDSSDFVIPLPERFVDKNFTLAISVTTDSTHFLPFSELQPVDIDRLDGEVEDSQSIRGSIEDSDGLKLDRNIKVMLLAPTEDFYLTTVADSDGRFSFSDLELADSTFLLVRTPASYLRISLDEDEFPKCNYLKELGYDTDVVKLEGITVTAQRQIREEKQMGYLSNLADYTFPLDKIESIRPSSVTDILRLVPSLYVTASGEVHFLTRNSIFNTNTSGSIAVNGILMWEGFKPDEINIDDVLRVDIFKGGSTILWGNGVGSGVISITTKRGNESIGAISESNMRKRYAFGYQSFRPFESSRSRTIFWNPYITSFKGDRMVLRLPDIPGMQIRLMGICEDGERIDTILP